MEEALANARDAFAVVLEISEGEGLPPPPGLIQDVRHGPIQPEHLAIP